MLEPDYTPEWSEEPTAAEARETVEAGEGAGAILGAALALMLLAAFLAGAVIHKRHAARLAAGEIVQVAP